MCWGRWRNLATNVSHFNITPEWNVGREWPPEHYERNLWSHVKFLIIPHESSNIKFFGLCSDWTVTGFEGEGSRKISSLHSRAKRKVNFLLLHLKLKEDVEGASEQMTVTMSYATPEARNRCSVLVAITGTTNWRSAGCISTWLTGWLACPVLHINPGKISTFWECCAQGNWNLETHCVTSLFSVLTPFVSFLFVALRLARLWNSTAERAFILFFFLNFDFWEPYSHMPIHWHFVKRDWYSVNSYNHNKQ